MCIRDRCGTPRASRRVQSALLLHPSSTDAVRPSRCTNNPSPPPPIPGRQSCRAPQCLHSAPRRETACTSASIRSCRVSTVSYTHLRAHETPEHLVCRLLLEKKKK